MAQLLKNKKLLIISGVVLAVLVCGIFALYTAAHITINDTSYSREITRLDLSGVENPELEKIAELSGLEQLDLRDTGISVQDYEALRAALPDCAIRWSLPFQGGYCDSETGTLTVNTLSDEDLAALAYLPNLTEINAMDCRDYEPLLSLRQSRPDLKISYLVELGGSTFSPEVSSLTLESITAAELEYFLPHLPNLTSVTLTGTQTDSLGLLELMESNPGLSISWDLEICGVTVNSLAEEVDLSDREVEDLAALEKLVSRMPNMKKVIMCHCGFTNPEMEALNNRHEDILFVWTVTVKRMEFRTDITYFMPYEYNLWPGTADVENLRYFTELVCLDLGHHFINHCDFVAYMPKLKYLILADTQVSDLTPLTGLQDLVYLEIFMSGVTDYSPILTLPNLEVLNISYTRGQPEVIAQLTWVDHIRWVTNEEFALPQSQIAWLQEQLPNTLLETGIMLSSTGGEWRKTQQYRDMRDILGRGYMIG